MHFNRKAWEFFCILVNFVVVLFCYWCKSNLVGVGSTFIKIAGIASSYNCYNKSIHNFDRLICWWLKIQLNIRLDIDFNYVSNCMLDHLVYFFAGSWDAQRFFIAGLGFAGAWFFALCWLLFFFLLFAGLLLGIFYGRSQQIHIAILILIGFVLLLFVAGWFFVVFTTRFVFCLGIAVRFGFLWFRFALSGFFWFFAIWSLERSIFNHLVIALLRQCLITAEWPVKEKNKCYFVEDSIWRNRALTYTSKSMSNALCGSSTSFWSLSSGSETLAPSGISISELTTCRGWGSKMQFKTINNWVQLLLSTSKMLFSTDLLPTHWWCLCAWTFCSFCSSYAIFLLSFVHQDICPTVS